MTISRILAAAFLLAVFFGTGLYLENGRVDLGAIPALDSLQTRLQPVADQLRTDVAAAIKIGSEELSDLTDSGVNGQNQRATGSSHIDGGLKKGQVLVIIASTMSEEAALNHAKQLQDRGHDSEVVLSTNGYYGVALGRFSYEQALSMGEATNREGNKTPSSYIMRTSSIRSFVYP